TGAATGRSGAARPRAAASRATRNGCRAASASGRRSSEHEIGEGDVAIALEVHADDLDRAHVEQVLHLRGAPHRAPVDADDHVALAEARGPAHLRRDAE